jgi:predicted RNA-binding protein with PUA domain
MVGVVTETRELDEVISEALAVIDKGLGELLHRELVSTNEVADLLLDVRTLLANPHPDHDDADEVVVAS